MNKIFWPLGVCLSFVLLTTGCYTKIAVNFGNGISTGVRVRSSATGQEIEVAPDKFKKFPHGSGDLIVTTQSDGSFTFPAVTPFDVGRKYHKVGHSVFGPNSITLSVKLETNMHLYVLMPAEKNVDRRVPQPTGYPKAGKRISY